MLDGEPFTGTAFTLLKDGRDKAVMEYRRGLRWGITRWSKKWDEDGTLVEDYALAETDAGWVVLLRHREIYGGHDDE